MEGVNSGVGRKATKKIDTDKRQNIFIATQSPQKWKKNHPVLTQRRKVASYLPTPAVKFPSAYLETRADSKKNKKRSCDSNTGRPVETTFVCAGAVALMIDCRHWLDIWLSALMGGAGDGAGGQNNDPGMGFQRWKLLFMAFSATFLPPSPLLWWIDRLVSPHSFGLWLCFIHVSPRCVCECPQILTYNSMRKRLSIFFKPSVHEAALVGLTGRKNHCRHIK